MTTQPFSQGISPELKNELTKLIDGNLDNRMLWQDAVVRFQIETKNKDHINEATLFKIASKYLNDLYLDEINRQHINDIVQCRLNEGVSNTTVNRLLQKVRALLRKARREWEVACNDIYIKLLPEPKIRIRWLTKKESNALLSALPTHLKPVVQLALETGLRESNLTLLRWDQIDFSARVIFIEGHDVLKGNKPYVVPLSDKTIKVLKKLKGKHRTRVFTFRKRPIRRAGGKSFRNAVQRAGITHFRFHDLRHTWATWHVQQGTPLDVLQELGGWSDFKMVKRYAHYSHDHLHQYVGFSQPKTRDAMQAI